MTFAFILLLCGLFLIFLEFYTPGGIVATLGILLTIFSVVIFLYSTPEPSFFASFAFLVLALGGTVFMIWFALYRIKKSASENTFYLSSDQEGYQGAEFNASLIGKTGVTLSDMGPSGFILIDGVRYQATCPGRYLDKGKEVLVVGGEAARLIVQPKE